VTQADPPRQERPLPAGNYDLYRGQTPGQTLGPFFHQGLVRTPATGSQPASGADARDWINNVLIDERTAGQRVCIEGVVYDGLHEPVADALLEIWQANAHGRYKHPLDSSERSLDPAFFGFGRAATDSNGAFSFQTIKPGLVPGASGRVQAPHLSVVLGARGLARHAFTRIYFDADPELLTDPVLSRVPASRRPTLLARLAGERDGVQHFVFDIHLQGENETVFFEF
jgi:protocatechuate 3,4-dioxygenase, alpha subunit